MTNQTVCSHTTTTYSEHRCRMLCTKNTTDHDEKDSDGLINVGGGDADGFSAGSLHVHAGPDLGIEDDAQTTLCPHHCNTPLHSLIIIIIIIIITFKGAIQDFLQSPHSAANCLQHARSSGPGATNCLQHARSSGPGAIVCKSRETHRALITCNMLCYMPLGTKGQLSY